MPTSNTSSPVKRPGLGRRAISSHAVVTRTTPSVPVGELSHSHNQKVTVHRPHRPHVVGGGHRNHARNPSFGKNLAKLQRFNSTQHFGAEGTARNHHRKKSAPATPAATTPATSPRGQNHVRWDGALDDPKPATSMKKNYSSPALRRNSSGALGKKSLVTDRPQSSSGKKKTVGFELGDSDNDDGDWEDTTQSPESTRRSSVVAQSKDSVENTAVLVDPLTFVKRPYPQIPRATSLPEPASRSLTREDHSSDDDEDDNSDQQPTSDAEKQREEESDRALDHSDIASRLLSPSHAAKAPPAMSSISAMAKPALVDTLSRNTSLSNMATGYDGSRRTASSSNPTLANTPGNQTNATSSSIEGGVSRFIINNKTGIHASSRTDSDPNTPSSFLPHYHPQTPPSPNGRTGSKKPRASPPSRVPGAEPHSRTQQKLWLQRTAALNTSPPDSHGVSTTASPSTMDPTFMAGTHTRGVSGPYDSGRVLVNGSGRASGVTHDNDAKHIRKAYEKMSLELTVVRQFQSPTGDSFTRLRAVTESRDLVLGHARNASSLGKPVKSAPALTQLQDGQQANRESDGTSPEPRQLIGRKAPEMKTSASHTYLQDPEDLVNTSESTDLALRQKSQHPSHRILSTSDETAHGNTHAEDDLEDHYYTNATEMMIRRMWESREVASSG